MFTVKLPVNDDAEGTSEYDVMLQPAKYWLALMLNVPNKGVPIEATNEYMSDVH